MKTLKQLALTGALACGLIATALAQDTKPTTGAGGGAGDPATGAGMNGKPMDRADLPADVKALVDQLAAARDAFIAEQKALTAKLKDASADDRAAIRAELKADAKNFADSTKQLREQIKDRLKELKAAMPDRKKPLDAAGTTTGRPGSK